MTVKEFKMWLIKNDHDYNSLSKRLGITSRTIQNYVSNERFPFMFVLALVVIERGLDIHSLGED